MYLYKIGKDKWTVLAYAKDKRDCPVLEFLLDRSVYKNDKTKMITLLSDKVPIRGPSKSENFSKHLEGNIFEFKRGPRRGLKIRVLYFYGQNRLIICTHAFMKSNKTPQNLIENAEKIRTEYLRDKKLNQIKILEMEDTYEK